MLKYNTTYKIKYRQSASQPFLSVFVDKNSVKYCLTYCIGSAFLKDFQFIYDLNNPCHILYDGFYFNKNCNEVDEIVKELDKYNEYFTLRKNLKPTGSILLEIIYRDEKLEDLISYFILLGEIESFVECKDWIKIVK